MKGDTGKPAKIGRYEIVDQLGEGGMGIVYLATDPLLRRTVAIKSLPGRDEELRERFAREGRSAASLRHNNIVTIYDVGEEDGNPFLAMEFIDGESMAELIRRRAPLTVEQRLKMMSELCAGLGYAHKNGIVHRDIKPGNLMITAEGTLKVLDFGLARITTEGMTTGLTRAGSILGTPHYMSPEQVGGKPVDPRSDIFSVGLVFYELLCYQRAYSGNSAHVVLHNIVHTKPRPIQELVPEIDPDLARIVEKSIEKQPEDRYQDLRVLAADLERVRARADTNAGTTRIERWPLAGRTSSPPTGGEATPVREGRARAQADLLAQRRIAQVDSHVKAAGEYLAAGRYEEAVAACENAMLLSPQDQRALSLLAQAQAAIDDRQVRQNLSEARARLATGELTAAQALVDQTLMLHADLAEAQQLRREIWEKRAELERLAERARAARTALERARRNLEEGAFEAASRSAAEVLAYDATNEGALEIRRRAAEAIEARRLQHERDLRAANVIEQAQIRAAAGSPRSALAFLEAFAPPHPLVTGAMARMRAEIAVEEQRRRDRVASLKKAAKDALEARRLTDALSAIELATSESPDDLELQELHARIRAAEEEAAAAKARAAAVAAQERREAEERARREAEERARREAEEQARREAEAQARREAEAQARREAEAQARREAEAQARREAEEQARREAEERARREAEEQARREAEEQARREAEEQARREAEEQARREAEEQARREAEEKARREAEEQARREAEEKARREAQMKARREAEEKARREAEEKARREAEEKARREAEEKARREAEEKARREAEEKARREAEEKARREAEEKARREAEEKARREAEEKARREAEEKARREAEEKARREAEDKARREAEEKARRVAEEKARRNAEEKARREADEKARREANEMAGRAAGDTAGREADEEPIAARTDETMVGRSRETVSVTPPPIPPPSAIPTPSATPVVGSGDTATTGRRVGASRSPAVLGGVAAVLILLLGAGWYFTRDRTEPASSATLDTEPTGVISGSPAKRPDSATAVDAPPAPVSAPPADVPATTSASAADEMEAEVAKIHTAFTAAMRRNNLDQAARLLSGTPASLRTNRTIAGDSNRLLAATKQRASAALSQSQTNPASLASNDFRAAETRKLEAANLERRGQLPEAASEYLAAAEGYRRALAVKPPPVVANEPRILPSAPAPTPPSTTTANPPAPAPAPTATVKETPPAPSAPPATREPVDSAAADTAAIKETLAQFVAGYERLDVPAIKRVYPNAPANLTFNNVRSYSLTLDAPQISISGDRATVRTVRRLRVQMRAGSPQQQALPTEFSLRRMGNAWVVETIK